MVENSVPKKMRFAFMGTLIIMLSALLFVSICGILPGSNPAMNPPLDFGKHTTLRGINLGNALEAPAPGNWGVTIKPIYFETIRDAGFNCVRIPVCFSAHISQTTPYTIEPKFLNMVDTIVNQGLDAGLTVILDLHHYDEIMVDPTGQREKFQAIWEQLAKHYQNAPSTLYFELLNEPNQQLDSDTWNILVNDTVQLIRESNPVRKILIGGTNFNSVESLNQLQLPSDKNLIAAFHFYMPFEFTHQGAAWVKGSGSWIGTTWEGTPEEKQAIVDQLDFAASWSEKNQTPLIMGEFGSIAAADDASRQRWTEFVTREVERRNIGWLYWEFCSEFRVYDCQLDAWDVNLLKALIVK